MGSVGQAARAVGMGRRSAYRLRDRPGAESFAQAWDRAIAMGRMRQFDYAMDRAINGITTVRSEEHTSELQSLMRISYAVFCLQKKNDIHREKIDVTTKHT